MINSHKLKKIGMPMPMPMQPDIVFDFSSSPIRGAVRRLDAYIEYFRSHRLDVVFLVHDALKERYTASGNLKIIYIKKNIINKIFLRNAYLLHLKINPKWLFSYGIPISQPIGKKNWLHISNVLPFADSKIKLSMLLKLKMKILNIQYSIFSKAADVVSAESAFSLEKYSEFNRPPISVTLFNGIENKEFDSKHSFITMGKYAMVSGTQPYKRVDKSYKLYQELKGKYNLTTLIIVGSSKMLKQKFKKLPDVRVIDHLDDSDYFPMLTHAEIFISSTEIENSSCAILEAICHCKKSYFSDIPPTRELLNMPDVSWYKQGADLYLVVKKGSLKCSAIIDHCWRNEIDKMLRAMNFESNN